MSPFHHFTISPFHHFTISPFHHFTISPSQPHPQTVPHPRSGCRAARHERQARRAT
jgi:hypothetical protein